MTKKIFRSILLAASAVLLACVLIILSVLYDYFTALQNNRLASQLALAAQGVESAGIAYLDGLTAEDCRITLIDTDGTVLYDTQADPASMENHADREEVREALATGTGDSARYSSTLAEKTFYRAQRLSDGTVLRLSSTQYSVIALLLGMERPLAVVILAAAALSFFLARRLSRRIVQPLDAIDLDRPLENDVYEELTPLLTRLERQHRQIDAQREELRRRKEEFSAITDSMNEGLVLLSGKGAVLSINPAARRIFGADGVSEGEDFLRIDRSIAVEELLRAAAAQGHAEAVLERAGRKYQADASRIGEAGADGGVVLLAFDVTERAYAERNRREFTANVSHELKTPLQSILGAAELIENGLVRTEDLPRFAGNIRAEASRLVALIDDIIRLSQLDEGAALPFEALDLAALARETAASLAAAAEEKKVQLSVCGDSASVYGVRRLVQEILFNLCDNAVKYNRPGGSVRIDVKDTPDGALLCVSDTGIGIPPADRDRVFERFYRVDKSHSRSTGGTGLGLSIVKHAAQLLGAQLTLESTLSEGTSVRVLFAQETSQQ
ncbi:MAG: ATP-binding protein [Oscillospiraceae bacterium]|nr:ATP-binding protein [Oscillospiraceae bacterium]